MIGAGHMGRFHAEKFSRLPGVELAAVVDPDPARAPDVLSLSPAFLAVAIAGVALTVLGMSLVGVLADRRLALRTSRFEEIISQLSLARQQVDVLRQQRERLLHVHVPAREQR